MYTVQRTVYDVHCTSTYNTTHPCRLYYKPHIAHWTHIYKYVYDIYPIQNSHKLNYPHKKTHNISPIWHFAHLYSPTVYTTFTHAYTNLHAHTSHTLHHTPTHAYTCWCLIWQTNLTCYTRQASSQYDQVEQV